MNSPRSNDKSTLWFCSGRQALFALFSRLIDRGVTTAWLPEYHCLSMVSPCVQAGTNVRFYRVDERLAPRIETLTDLGATDAMVAVHYFGFPYDFTEAATLCAARGALLVEDAAHVNLASNAASRTAGAFGDYALYCPRKFHRVYDGAVLVGARSTLGGIERRTPSLREQAKSLVALAGSLRGGAGLCAPPFDVAPDPPSGQVDDYVDPRFKIDARTRATVASRVAFAVTFDAKSRAARRRRRFAAIHDVVSTAQAIRPLFAEWPQDMVPYVYPAILAEPEDFRRFRHLGFNVLRWEQFGVDLSERIAPLRWALVQLPCCDAMAESTFRRLLTHLGTHWTDR